jgi:hypothetical protein
MRMIVLGMVVMNLTAVGLPADHDAELGCGMIVFQLFDQLCVLQREA